MKQEVHILLPATSHVFTCVFASSLEMYNVLWDTIVSHHVSIHSLLFSLHGPAECVGEEFLREATATGL